MKILHIYILQIVLLVIRNGRLQFDSYIILNNKPCLASKHYAEKKEKIIDLRKKLQILKHYVKMVFIDIFFVQ